MIRKAKAVWRGTGRAGSGNLSTDSGVLAATPYSFRTRFENEKGTNTEELIAAAHAGCFTNVPNLDEAGFRRMAEDAEKNCPVSKVLNAAITLDAKLV
jgi:osmotically inducible protein OsmC